MVSDKCFMMNTDKDNDLYIDIEWETIVCENLVKLLGIKIDNQLTFSEHVSSICKKVSLKLHALARVSKYMNQDKLMKAFI